MNQVAEQPTQKKLPQFDRLARLYRWMELLSFGPCLMRCRCAFLPQLTSARHALLLGDGDGRFTARLLAANPTVEVEAIDGSSRMLKTLVHNAGADAGRLRVLQADLRAWQPDPEADFDLVVTHFFLDCLTTDEVSRLATAVRQRCTPTARWVVSEFAVPEGWFGRLVARWVVRGLYLAFAFLTGLTVCRLPQHASALSEAGFVLEQRRSWLGGLLVSELWSIQPHLNKI